MILCLRSHNVQFFMNYFLLLIRILSIGQRVSCDRVIHKITRQNQFTLSAQTNANFALSSEKIISKCFYFKLFKLIRHETVKINGTEKYICAIMSKPTHQSKKKQLAFLTCQLNLFFFMCKFKFAYFTDSNKKKKL